MSSPAVCECLWCFFTCGSSPFLHLRCYHLIAFAARYLFEHSCLFAFSGFVSRLNFGSSKICPGMPVANNIQCPKSLVAFFLAEVYRSAGSSQVLPRLLESVERDQLSSIQFLRNGAVRLTFKEVLWAGSFCPEE